jgi:hypothetical protein
MTCIDIGDLCAYMEGGLTEPERKRIEEHLEACQDCARTLEEERNLAQFVSNALAVEIPSGVQESFLTADEIRALVEQDAPSVTPISAGDTTRGNPGRRRATFLPEWLILQPQLQAASVVLLFLGGAYLWQTGYRASPSLVPEVSPSTPPSVSEARTPLHSAAGARGIDSLYLDEALLDSIATIDGDEIDAAQITPPPVSAEAPAIAKGFPAIDDELPTQEIRTGETILGRLEVEDVALDDGSFADLWIYRARAGRTVIIDLLSNDFDTYLVIGNEDADIIAENDDANEETLNSRISFTPKKSGSYVIVVNSYEENGIGQYALSVTLENPNAESTGRAPDLVEPDWETLYPQDGDPNDRYALIVGIADYPGREEDLIGPDVDAREFGRLLVDEYGFQQRNIVTLTDSEATRGNIVEGFSRHLGQAGPNGVAVFFYSGHGTQLEDNFGLGGIYDPEPDGRDEAIIVWGSTEYAAISDDEIGILADRLEANRTLIILDACHAGTGTRSDTPDGRQPKWIELEEIEQSIERPEKYLTRTETTPSISVGSTSIEVSDPERHVLLAASAAEEKAYTDPEFGYGVFTRMLVEEMRNASTGATFDDVMGTVRKRTLARTGGIQTPQTEGRLSSIRIRDFLSRNR